MQVSVFSMALYWQFYYKPWLDRSNMSISFYYLMSLHLHKHVTLHNLAGKSIGVHPSFSELFYIIAGSSLTIILSQLSIPTHIFIIPWSTIHQTRFFLDIFCLCYEQFSLTLSASFSLKPYKIIYEFIRLPDLFIFIAQINPCLPVLIWGLPGTVQPGFTADVIRYSFRSSVGIFSCTSSTIFFCVFNAYAVNSPVSRN